MPRLWTDTIEAHRSQVHDAILDAAARLADRHGITGVSMSDVAAEAGIGRATLYKYFPNVEAILVAWHAAQVERHVAELQAARDRGGSPLEQLTRVLGAYAAICHGHHGSAIAVAVHDADHMHGPRAHLRAFVEDLVVAAAAAGQVRADVPAGELAVFALAAVQAANELPSRAAVDRLVATTVAGLVP